MAAPATTVFLLTELVEKCLGSRVHTVLKRDKLLDELTLVNLSNIMLDKFDDSVSLL
uniref:Uncharacterized protein n=1 Tax=Strix occidentalis caurina TaxID=311401 RepID=A0A8D0ER24_STROC